MNLSFLWHPYPYKDLNQKTIYNSISYNFFRSFEKIIEGVLKKHRFYANMTLFLTVEKILPQKTEITETPIQRFNAFPSIFNEFKLSASARAKGGYHL
jgi:hypothetical protein